MNKSYFGVKIREPIEQERWFFLNNRDTPGYAADDDKIVLNPFAVRSKEEMDSVAKNEALRVLLRSSQAQPQFELTPEQQQSFQGYSQNPTDIQHTIFSRIITGDPSAKATEQQRKYATQVFGQIMKEKYGK
jgi:hypothetical protein